MKQLLPVPVRALIESAVQEAGVRLFDVEFNGRTLQVFIETDSGVTIGECARVSELVAQRLDQADVMVGRYYLEVSSPGLERNLRGIEDFRRQQGKYVRVVTSHGAIDGTIVSATEAAVELRTIGRNGDSETATVPFADIRRANLKVLDHELFVRPRQDSPKNRPADQTRKRLQKSTERSEERR